MGQWFTIHLISRLVKQDYWTYGVSGKNRTDNGYSTTVSFIALPGNLQAVIGSKNNQREVGG